MTSLNNPVPMDTKKGHYFVDLKTSKLSNKLMMCTRMHSCNFQRGRSDQWQFSLGSILLKWEVEKYIFLTCMHVKRPYVPLDILGLNEWVSDAGQEILESFLEKSGLIEFCLKQIIHSRYLIWPAYLSAITS